MARNHRTDMIPPEYKPTATLLAAALCGVGGVYMALVVRQFGAAPLVPVKDPFLTDSLEYDNG